jgi:serine/threonine-protein kinase
MEATTTARYIGRYEIIRELGRGGTATVYEALDTAADGRPVALKALTPAAQMPPQEREAMFLRLQREARLIEHLDHPGLVEVLDLGVDDRNPDAPLPYLVMELVPGETLAQRLERTGPLPPAEAIAVLEQIAAALDAIHAAGIVHRDVKPSNVMLQPDGRVKLMDFGIARLHDDTMITRTGAIIGSPAYMSPEQAMGQPATAASDRWALAALAYIALTGQLPFQGGNIPAVLHQVIYGTFAPLPASVPEALAGVFEQALAREPAARYPTAVALADALRRAKEQGHAPPPSPAIRATALVPAPVPERRTPERPTAAMGLKLPLRFLMVSAPLTFALFGWSMGQRGDAPRTVAAVPPPHAASARPATEALTITMLRAKVAARGRASTLPSPAVTAAAATKAKHKRVTPRPTPRPTARPKPTVRSTRPSPAPTLALREKKRSGGKGDYRVAVVKRPKKRPKKRTMRVNTLVPAGTKRTAPPHWTRNEN